MAGGKGQVEAIIRLVGEDKITAIINDVEAGLKGVDDETKNASESTGGLAEQWGTVATGINQGIELMKKAGAAAQWVMEQARTGAKEQATHAMFLQMTKDIGGAGLAIKALEKAAAGGLAKTEMEQLSMRALRANLSLGQTAQLFELARKAAHAGIGEQSELTEQFVTGIVDRSDSVFKAMGLEVDFGMEVAKVSVEMGVSADALGLNNQRAISFAKAVGELTEELKDVPFSETIAKLNEWESALRDLAAAERLAKMVDFGIGAEDVQRSNELLRNLEFLSAEKYKAGNMPFWFDIDESSGAEWQKSVAKRFDTSGDHGHGWISVLKQIQKTAAAGNTEDIAFMKQIDALGSSNFERSVKQSLVERRMKEDATAGLVDEIRIMKERGGIGWMQFENVIQQQIREVTGRAQASGGLMDYATAQGIVLNKLGLTALMKEGLLDQEDAHVDAMNAGVDASRKQTSANDAQLVSIRAMLTDLPRLSNTLGTIVRDDERLAAAQGEVVAKFMMTGAITAEVGQELLKLIKTKKLDGDVTRTNTEVEERHLKLQHYALDTLMHQQNMLLKNAMIQAEYAESLGRTKMALGLWKKAAGAIPNSMVLLARATVKQMGSMAKATKNLAATAILAQVKVVQAGKVAAEQQAASASIFDFALQAKLQGQIKYADMRIQQLKGIAASALAIGAGVSASGGGGGGGAVAAEKILLHTKKGLIVVLGEESRVRTKAALAAEKEAQRRVAVNRAALALAKKRMHEERTAANDLIYWRTQREVEASTDIIDASEGEIDVMQRKAKLVKLIGMAEEKWRSKLLAAKLDRQMEDPERLAAGATREEQTVRDLKQRLKDVNEEIKTGADEVALHIQNSAQSAFANSVSYAGQFGNQWVAAFGQSISIIDVEITKFEDMQKKLLAAGENVGDAWKKSAPAMLSASGAITAGFIEDAQARALVQGGFEFAASMASLAIPDYKGAALHGLASVLYFAVAATSGSKGGGGRGAGKYTPVAMTPQKAKTGEGGAQSITLNFSGTIVGTDTVAARQLATMLQRELRWGLSTPTAVA